MGSSHHRAITRTTGGLEGDMDLDLGMDLTMGLAMGGLAMEILGARLARDCAQV